MNTQYGGFVAISLFGPKAIDAFLLPLAIHYWNQWEAKLDSTTDLQQRMELQMCEHAILVRFCCVMLCGVLSFWLLVWSWILKAPLVPCAFIRT